MVMATDPKFWEGVWRDEHAYVQAAIRRAWWLYLAVNAGIIAAALLMARRHR
jgi:hypothetical protein